MMMGCLLEISLDCAPRRGRQVWRARAAPPPLRGRGRGRGRGAAVRGPSRRRSLPAPSPGPRQRQGSAMRDRDAAEPWHGNCAVRVRAGEGAYCPALGCVLPGGHIHDLDRPIRVSNLARRFEVWRGRAARVDDERAVVALDSVCERQRGT